MASAQQSFEFYNQEDQPSGVQKKPEESSGMAKIVTNVKLGFELRTMAGDDIKAALSRLDIPIYDEEEQRIAFLSNTEKEVSQLRVSVEYIERVRDALTDALETRGLKAEINRAGNEVEISMVPSEDPYEAIGSRKR